MFFILLVIKKSHSGISCLAYCCCFMQEHRNHMAAFFGETLGLFMLLVPAAVSFSVSQLHLDLSLIACVDREPVFPLSPPGALWTVCMVLLALFSGRVCF